MYVHVSVSLYIYMHTYTCICMYLCTYVHKYIDPACVEGRAILFVFQQYYHFSWTVIVLSLELLEEVVTVMKGSLKGI